jgi:hypothetical protein
MLGALKNVGDVATFGLSGGCGSESQWAGSARRGFQSSSSPTALNWDWAHGRDRSLFRRARRRGGVVAEELSLRETSRSWKSNETLP